MTLSAMKHIASGLPARVEYTDTLGVVRASVGGAPWEVYPAAFFAPLEVQGPSVLDAQLAESARVAQTVPSQAPASPAMQEAVRRGFAAASPLWAAFVDGAEWAAVSRPVPTRHTILGVLPVDENTIDQLDKTITDLREHMEGMRDKAEAQDATANRLHCELSAARAAVREADERVRTANLCVKYAKSHISGIASADALRGLRKRLQKSLKNV